MKFGLVLVLAMVPGFGIAQNINFGDDKSEWARDGECDDRRFRGSAMATGLDRDDVGHDATDCRRGFRQGKLKIWDFAAAKAATQCKRINFGDNTSEWRNDGLCDDYRFDGPGADFVLLSEDIGHDAADCRAQCELGQIALRDY